jgi:hypothetical protein
MVPSSPRKLDVHNKRKIIWCAKDGTSEIKLEVRGLPLIFQLRAAGLGAKS